MLHNPIPWLRLEHVGQEQDSGPICAHLGSTPLVTRDRRVTPEIASRMFRSRLVAMLGSGLPATPVAASRGAPYCDSAQRPASAATSDRTATSARDIGRHLRSQV